MQSSVQQSNSAQQVLSIPMEQIALRQEHPFANQEGGVSIRELASSIRRDGLIQPITVRMGADGRYVVVSGNRRLLACRICGMDRIDAVVLPGDAQSDETRQTLDALCSGTLDDLDEADAIHRLCEEGGMNRIVLARRLGCTEQMLKDKLRLVSLSAPVRALLQTYHLPSRMAYALLRIPDADKQLAIARQAVRQHLSVSDVELLIASTLRQPTAEGTPHRKPISLVRDERFYVNAIRTVVGQMQDAGLQAELTELPFSTQLQLTIRIPIQRKRRAERHRRAIQ